MRRLGDFLSSTDQGKTWTTNNLGYSGRAFQLRCLALVDSPSVRPFTGPMKGYFDPYDEG